MIGSFTLRHKKFLLFFKLPLATSFNLGRQSIIKLSRRMEVKNTEEIKQKNSSD